MKWCRGAVVLRALRCGVVRRSVGGCTMSKIKTRRDAGSAGQEQAVCGCSGGVSIERGDGNGGVEQMGPRWYGLGRDADGGTEV